MSITFATPFPTNVVSIQISPKDTNYISEQLFVVTQLTTTSFTVEDNSPWAGNYADGFYWQAWGY